MMRAKQFKAPLLYAVAAVIAFLGNIASNWMTNDLQQSLEPYRLWVWVACASAFVTAVITAFIASRQPTGAANQTSEIGAASRPTDLVTAGDSVSSLLGAETRQNSPSRNRPHIQIEERSIAMSSSNEPGASGKDRLTEAVLDCACMQDLQSRNQVIADLPAEIRDKIKRHPSNKQDVDEIVRACGQFPNGLKTLLQRVRYFEGDSFAWRRVESIASETGALEESAASTVTATAGALQTNRESPPGRPIEVFFSYSHKDEVLRDELSAHLSILKRQGVISEWSDRQIPPGREWVAEIDNRIDRAQVILLLISSDFLASNYCHEIEMKRAMERHERGEVVVIPVILRPCAWKGSIFGKLLALPKDAKAVTGWPNRDEAFTNVAEGIRRAIEGIRAGTIPR